MAVYVPINSTPRIINKLILVGNGFDLSLGLKTSYEDFLLWYFKKNITKSFESERPTLSKNEEILYYHYEDELFSFYTKSPYTYNVYEFQKLLNSLDSYDEIKNFLLKNNAQFTHNFKSNLLKNIFKNSIHSWVDIEQTYFRLLKECINEKKINVVALNNELHQLKLLLHEYLKQLDYSSSSNSKYTFHYGKQFSKTIEKNEIIDPSIIDEDIVTEKLFFLNFNYTHTVYNAIQSSMFNDRGVFKDVIVSQIHSSLKNTPESLVFGYGDEMDLEYKKIEELNDNRYFDGIKSFKYAENSSYRDLLRFLNSDDYQVLVYGHSCGLSDRVMLNEIFEHERCKSIKICYYDKKEFVNKTMDISRHFTNNQMMRKKIVEFNEEDVMPQFSSFIQ